MEGYMWKAPSRRGPLALPGYEWGKARSAQRMPCPGGHVPLTLPRSLILHILRIYLQLLLMSFAHFVTAKTFREPFFDLLDEEDILALDHLQVQKGTSPGKGEEQHEGLRARD